MAKRTEEELEIKDNALEPLEDSLSMDSMEIDPSLLYNIDPNDPDSIYAF